MTRSTFLLTLAISFIAALPSCRPTPSDAERRWEQGLKDSLPEEWTVVAVVGDPKNNTFMCWLSAPGKDGKEYRVEVKVRPGVGGTRLWDVLVHPPTKRNPDASVKFHVPNDGEGQLELHPDSQGRESFAEEVRPLAEEAVRQVKGLGLF